MEIATGRAFGARVTLCEEKRDSSSDTVCTHAFDFTHVNKVENVVCQTLKASGSILLQQTVIRMCRLYMFALLSCILTMYCGRRENKCDESALNTDRNPSGPRSF